MGTDAPVFSLTTLDGKIVTRTDLTESIAVLDFFAPTCPHCKKQMPRVEALRRTYEERGVRFLFITETMGGAPVPSLELAATLKQLGVAAPAALDAGNTVGKLFRVSGYPTLFVISKGGRIEAVTSGNSADLEKKLQAQLDDLLAGKAVSLRN